ncbi:6880_t:CDS:2 [Funneliformis caledonium]|uniref:6880_t:CDS:1 n=2 Tax=Funneliformis TaxID=1117308 RepID=A0A9N9AYM0_9GLOM|nr:6880_t:CDS:2 [Funneliformis caledonium]CAG8548288.1 256_t:CDS:2 [Funneliformis mosseae]
MTSDSTKPGEIKANVPTPQFKNTEIKASAQHPDPNASVGEKASSAMATLSSHADPYPHYFMSAFSGMGAVYAHRNMNQPKTAAVAGVIALAYAASGYLINKGNHTMGYNIATLTSLGLLATSGPSAFATKDAFHVAMTSLGAVSTAGNSLKWYQLKSGKPRDLEINK